MFYTIKLFFTVRINDTVTFVEDGFDEDIEFGDEISDDDEEDVDNVSLLFNNIYSYTLIIKFKYEHSTIFASYFYRSDDLPSQ